MSMASTGSYQLILSLGCRPALRHLAGCFDHSFQNADN